MILTELPATIEKRLDLAGIQHGRLQLLSATTNPCFTDAAHIFVKVAGPLRHDANLQTELDLSLLPGNKEVTTQPAHRDIFHAQGASFTVWNFVGGVSPKESSMTGPTIALMLKTLSTFHEASKGFDGVLPSIRQYHETTAPFLDEKPDGIRDAVLDSIKRLVEIHLLGRTFDDSSPDVVHGDNRPANVIFSPNARPLLCDLDGALRGPREYDYGTLLFALSCYGGSDETVHALSDHVIAAGLDTNLVWAAARAKITRAMVADYLTRKDAQLQALLGHAAGRLFP